MLKPALSLAVLMVSFSLHAQVRRYEKSDVRAHLFAMMKVEPQKITVKGPLPNDPAKKEFIRLYLEEIQPEFEKMKSIDVRASILHLLMDSGSEDSPEEKKQWEADFNKLVAEYNEYSVNKEWNDKVVAWGKLGAGLKGELAKFAVQKGKEIEFSEFPPEMKPALDEVSEKMVAWQNAINETKAQSGLTEASVGIRKAEREFKAGDITFAEAQAKLSDLAQRVGSRYVGAEAVASHGHLLNEMAILRSKLAKSKLRADGTPYPTWAEFQLEASGQGYSAEYRSAAKQRAFLENWLDQARPAEEAYYDRRIKEMGLEAAKPSMRMQHLRLLSPPDLTLAQPYFPPDQITNIWEKAMLESGFDAKMMSQIIVDDQPRDGIKNGTNAYMSATIQPAAAAREIDPATLSVTDIGPKREALIYVLQSFRGGGLDELRTGLHELTGHAFEYLNKDAEMGGPEGYGYVETPSMTSEYFMDNPQFLHDNAIPHNGKIPTVDELRTWLKNQRIVDALGAVFRASSSLYDINIWDYDYDQPGAKTYLERVKEVSEDIDRRTETYTDAAMDSAQKVPMFNFWVASVHYVSGYVRNIGYTYATISSEMMARHISARLKELTGREGWDKQPLFASILINDFYKKGWQTTYPQNIEQITGQPYDYKAVLADLLEPLCEKALTN